MTLKTAEGAIAMAVTIWVAVAETRLGSLDKIIVSPKKSPSVKCFIFCCFPVLSVFVSIASPPKII